MTLVRFEMDVWCENCDEEENIEHIDSNEMSHLFYCKECKTQFERMR